MRMEWSPDSGPIRFLTRIFDLILLSVLTALLCATVVLSGAALTALYAVALKMVRGEDHRIVRSLFRALRENIVPSVPAAVLLFADGLLVVLLFRVLWAEELLLPPPLFVLLAAFAVLLTALLSYLFPLTARYENTFPRHLRNAAGLALANLPVTCLVTLVNLLPVLVVFGFPGAFGQTAALWAFFGIGAGAYVNAFYLRRVFDRLAAR